MNNKSLRNAPVLVTSLACIAWLTACGGGGGGGGGGSLSSGTPAPTVATGYFKDSNVAGLEFSSGAQSGTTDANGTFSYEVGQPVTFKVGKVMLGTVPGKAIVTPVDLVTGGDINSIAVQNLVRFLMMLDADGNPANGIQISAAVRTAAANWTTVDWTTADLAAALATIISDTRTADSGAHVLPDSTSAAAHLALTVHCVYSGGFKGTFGGSDTGRFGALVLADGIVVGFGYVPSAQQGFTAVGTTPVAVSQAAAFVAGTTSTGASFSGQFDSPDKMSGIWTNTATGGNGTFSGTRVGGSAAAVYRATGAYGSQSGAADAGLFTFDIDAADHVTGNAYSLVDDQLITITGSVSGTALTATASTGASITGTLDRTIGSLSGTYTGSSSAGTFGGSGCQLN